MRESIPRQVDKKFRFPEEERGSGALEEEIGVWNSQGGGKDKHIFFPLHSLVFVTENIFLLKPSTDDYTQTTHFKLCTKDYITTMYPASGQFLLPENLLANPVILKM